MVDVVVVIVSRIVDQFTSHFADSKTTLPIAKLNTQRSDVRTPVFGMDLSAAKSHGNDVARINP